MNPIAQISYNDKKYDVFSAPYNYNVSKYIVPNISNEENITEFTNLFTIPSIKYFYLSKKVDPKTNRNYFLPYIGNTIEDLVLWRKSMELDFFNVTIYSQTKFDYTNDAENAFYAIVDNATIVSESNNYLQEYIRSLLIELNIFTSDESSQDLNKERNEILKIFAKGGFSPASDYLSALNLCFNKNENDIQNYLDDIGIITFSAKYIINLSPSQIFFYLVHLYGPPYINNLNVGKIVRGYELISKTPLAVHLTNQIEKNFDIYNKGNVKQTFANFFSVANSDVNKPTQQILEEFAKALDTDSKKRIYSNIFDYLLLYELSKKEILSLKTFKKLCTATSNIEAVVQTLKETYTDNEITKLIFNKEDFQDIETRDEYIRRIVDYWLNNSIRLFTKEWSELCSNTETILRSDDFADTNEIFLASGSLSNKINCYAFDDLLQNFVSKTDAEGHVTFLNPIDKTNFSKEELVEVKNLAETIPSKTLIPYFTNENQDGKLTRDQLLAKLNEYIAIAVLQESSDYQTLKEIQRYSRTNEQHREQIKNLFMALFELGLYCRQWEGPGTPYPITQNIQGEPLQGTDREVNLSLKVTEAITKFDNLLNQLPETLRAIVNGLKIYIKTENGHRQYSVAGNPATIQSLHTRVKAGYECIRMSSGPYFYSAAYYLKTLLNVDIPGFALDSSVQQIV